MKDYSEIKELLLKFSFLGIENSKSTGAMLIGRAPHIAENAWLNRLYSPIDKIEILKLEDGINKKIPASYVDFLTDFSNGLNILGDTLCLFGYRSNYMRTVDFSWQPYSLNHGNIDGFKTVSVSSLPAAKPSAHNDKRSAMAENTFLI